MAAYEKITTPILSDRRAEAHGQDSLFGGAFAPALEIDESVLRGPEFDQADLLRSEKEMLGQYVTDHPLLGIKDALAAQTDLELSEVSTLGDGDVVSVAGILTSVNRKYTKRGEPYALLRLEDLTGGVGVVCFPGIFDKAGDLITTDRVVVVKGRADLRGRELQLVALEVREPDLGVDGDPGRGHGNGHAGGEGGGFDEVVVDIPASACTTGLIAHLKQLLALHPGSMPVVLRLTDEGAATRLRVGDGWRVSGSPALLTELRRLVGHAE